MQNIKILISDLKDINEIYSIEILSFEKPWNFMYFYSCYIHPQIKVFKATIKKKIIGFIIIREEEASIHILNLAVHPNYRNKKVGTDIINFIIDLYKNKFNKFYLEVRINNSVAISLYKKFGFKIEKLLKNYYGENKDGYLMLLEINNSIENNI